MSRLLVIMGSFVMLLSIASCNNDTIVKDNKAMSVSGSATYQVGIFPEKEGNEIAYELVEDMYLIRDNKDTTKQDLFLSFSIAYSKNGEDKFILNPKYFRHQIESQDGQQITYDSDKDDVHPILKTLKDINKNKLEIYLNNEGGINHFIWKNNQTNEGVEVSAEEDLEGDVFARTILTFFEFLPQKLVSEGEAWEHIGKLQLLGFPFEKHSYYSLVEVEGNIAKIVEKTEIKNFKSSNNNGENDFDLALQLEGKREATYVIDLEKQNLISNESEIVLEGFMMTGTDKIPIKIIGKGDVLSKIE